MEVGLAGAVPAVPADSVDVEAAFDVGVTELSAESDGLLVESFEREPLGMTASPADEIVVAFFATAYAIEQFTVFGAHGFNLLQLIEPMQNAVYGRRCYRHGVGA